MIIKAQPSKSKGRVNLAKQMAWITGGNRGIKLAVLVECGEVPGVRLPLHYPNDE